MRVVIAGYGVEGKASFDYWRGRGDTVVIADERATLAEIPDGIETILGDGAFSQLGDFDMIIRSPSVQPAKLAQYGKKVWSATNEFFAHCPAPIIGVTGTKGKGTTCSLIVSILRAAGKTVHLVGNIGVPALSILPDITPDDIVVYELSSFQLWDARKSPHVTVVLLIEPDHLDVHASYDEYLAAKLNIASHQQTNDTVIYHPTNSDSATIATQSPGTQLRYQTNESVYIKGDMFYDAAGPICITSAVQLPGRHNLENACAAIAAARQIMPSITSEAIEAGLRAFTGLPHRLKFVAEKRGVKYYDDSIATTPGSAIAALNAFAEPKLIILGGSDKGADYHAIVEACKATDSQVLAIGQTGQKIANICQEFGVTCTHLTDVTMTDIVQQASQLALPGSVVILSPASASFDMFASYADRGEQFTAAATQLP